MKLKSQLIGFGMLLCLAGCHKSDPAPPPVIYSFKPPSGIARIIVYIDGLNFSSSIPDNKVQFNGIDAELIYSDSKLLKVIVPVGSKTGRVTVTVKGQTTTSASDFVRNVWVSTVAGSGMFAFKDGNGDVARFASPQQIAFDAVGNLIVADGPNRRIRKSTSQRPRLSYPQLREVMWEAS